MEFGFNEARWTREHGTDLGDAADRLPRWAGHRYLTRGYLLEQLHRIRRLADTIDTR